MHLHVEGREWLIIKKTKTMAKMKKGSFADRWDKTHAGSKRSEKRSKGHKKDKH